jgi:hypothetical protein
MSRSASNPESVRALLRQDLSAPNDPNESIERRRNWQAARFGRAAAAHQFAAFYVESGFSSSGAYERMRPDIELTTAQKKTRGARWVLDRRVREAVIRLVEPAMQRAARTYDKILAQLEAEMDADIFEFIEEGSVPVKLQDRVEYVTGIRYKIDPSESNALRRRAVRSIRVQDGQVTHIQLADPNAARKQFVDIVTRLEQIRAGQKGKDGSLSKVLRTRLTRAKELQAAGAKKLPLPPNVTDFKIIDGQVIPERKGA